jgi:hypothetical protein
VLQDNERQSDEIAKVPVASPSAATPKAPEMSFVAHPAVPSSSRKLKSPNTVTVTEVTVAAVTTVPDALVKPITS